MNLPRVARWIVAAFAPADWRESLLGDLEEERARRIARGRTAGSLWAGAAALSAALHLRRARRQESRRMTTLQPSLLTSVAGALRDAARAVMRRPRRSVIAALTLTLGLAAVTMAFSLANWLLHRPVPGVGSPDEVVTIKLDLELRGRPGMLPISVPVWRELARLPTLAALGGAADASFHVAVDAAPAERVRGNHELLRSASASPRPWPGLRAGSRRSRPRAGRGRQSALPPAGARRRGRPDRADDSPQWARVHCHRRGGRRISRPGPRGPDGSLGATRVAPRVAAAVSTRSARWIARAVLLARRPSRARRLARADQRRCTRAPRPARGGQRARRGLRRTQLHGAAGYRRAVLAARAAAGDDDVRPGRGVHALPAGLRECRQPAVCRRDRTPGRSGDASCARREPRPAGRAVPARGTVAGARERRTRARPHRAWRSTARWSRRGRVPAAAHSGPRRRARVHRRPSRRAVRVCSRRSRPR